mgnify:CR=1 FL=1
MKTGGTGKLCSLEGAVSRYVENGDCIAFGGFSTNRKPFAAIHEIFRQGKRDFIAFGGAAGGDWDMMIGENRVKVYINCYTANSGVTNVGRRFREKIEKGELAFEDYSQDGIMLMLHAAALGLPFLPVRMMMGSDIEKKWRLSREERKKLDKVPDDKLIRMENPFKPGESILALPVPELDTAVIHVQKASPDGTSVILGDLFSDVDLAVAARKVIVTCEELTTEEEIRKDPSMGSIPGFCVDAVVHCPYGAHPTQLYGYYDYDTPYLKEYDRASRTDEGFHAFMENYVYGVKNHREYLEKIGAGRLMDLRVTPGLGYREERGKEAAGDERK